MMNEQNRLNDEQIAQFFYTKFERDQVRDFENLLHDIKVDGVIVDVGGGVGKFARQLIKHRENKIRVLDIDERSVRIANEVDDLRIEALKADALRPPVFGDEDIVTMNLVLHHLVGKDEETTSNIQETALKAWHGRAKYIFINEYIYESFLESASGKIIYRITSNATLSFIAAAISRLVPSLRANTFGVGVRFRTHSEWMAMFHRCGFELVNLSEGYLEKISLPRRLLLIKNIRRNSYLLAARKD